jgi:hypothetical protein
MVEKALLGEMKDKLVVCPGLEESLIHYSHARKVAKGASVPKSHHAKPISEYLGILNRGGVPNILELYALLCDFTHPGSSSVAHWFEQESETQFKLRIGRDLELIKNFLIEYKETFLPVLMFAFNPGIVSLAVLNYFSFPLIHTPDLLHWNLDRIPLWTKAKDHLRGIPLKLGNN